MYELLNFFKVPKSSYLSWKKNNKGKYIKEKDLIKQIFEENKARYGYRRITAELKHRGVVLNHKTVLKLMNELGLHNERKKVAKYNSYQGVVGKTAPNILDRHFDATVPDKFWCTDITEFKTNEGKVYLSPIKDLCTGEIISYRYSASPNLDLVVNMINDAISTHQDISNLMLHSDQGWHYQHMTFVNLLKINNITQSMSRKGNCLDNSLMENFFGIMKNEMFYGHEYEFKSLDELEQAMIEYIDYYNNKRITSKLKGLSPYLYRQQSFDCNIM